MNTPPWLCSYIHVQKIKIKILYYYIMFNHILNSGIRIIENQDLKKKHMFFYTYTFNGSQEEFPKKLIDDIKKTSSLFSKNQFYWGETGDNSKLINHYHAIVECDKFYQYSNIRKKMCSLKKAPYKITPPNKLIPRNLIKITPIDDAFNLLYLLGYYINKENLSQQYIDYKKLYVYNYAKNKPFEKFVDEKNLIKEQKKIGSKPDRQGRISCISKTHYHIQFKKFAEQYKIKINTTKGFSQLLLKLHLDGIAVLHFPKKILVQMYHNTLAYIDKEATERKVIEIKSLLDNFILDENDKLVDTRIYNTPDEDAIDWMAQKELETPSLPSLNEDVCNNDFGM